MCSDIVLHENYVLSSELFLHRKYVPSSDLVVHENYVLCSVLVSNLSECNTRNVNNLFS